MTETAKEIVAAIRDPDKQNYGAAMQACSPQERAFVLAIMDGKNFAAGARSAGYGTHESTAETFAKIGYRISHYPRVIDAIAEECKKAIRTTMPQAVTALREIVTDRFHRDRAKVAMGLIEKIDPTVQRQDVNVKHEIVDHRQEALVQLKTLKALGVARDRLEEVFGYSGLPMLERQLAEQETKQPIIEGDYIEIAPDPDADLLGE